MVKAVLDRVFIRLDAKEKTTSGGIILTDSHEGEQTIGTVEAVGPMFHQSKSGTECCSMCLTNCRAMTLRWLWCGKARFWVFLLMRIKNGSGRRESNVRSRKG
mgnify:CR=1 FL=1